MRTVNRTPKEIDTDVNNYSKYKNQLNFKGIVLDSNIFAVDQDSFTDTNNIYVDEDMSLISREPITIEDIPAGTMPDNSTLIDIQYAKDIVVYVSQSNSSKYTISAYKENSGVKTLSNVGQYHLSTYNQYIICFKDTGAQILNINDFTTGWQDFKNFTEVPVTKTVSGPSVKEGQSNQFTDAHKDVYIRTNEAQTVLPENSTAKVTGKIYSSYGTNTFKFNNQPSVLPEYRIIKPLNIEISNSILNISASKNILAITFIDYILLSYNGGTTFTRILLPTAGAGGIHTLSEDGKCYFYTAEEGVYRLTLDDLQWTLIRVKNGLTNETLSDSGKTYWTNIRQYYFKNAEVFTFYFNKRQYFKAPGMYADDIKYKNMLCYYDLSSVLPTDQLSTHTIYEDIYNYDMKINIDKDGNGYSSLAIRLPYDVPDDDDANKTKVVYRVYIVWIVGEKYGVSQFTKDLTYPGYVTITNSERLYEAPNGDNGYGVQISGTYNGKKSDSDAIYEYTGKIGYNTVTTASFNVITNGKLLHEGSSVNIGIPLMMQSGIYLLKVGQGPRLLDPSDNQTYSLVLVNNVFDGFQYNNITIAGDKFYILYHGIIYTNNFADDDIIEVTYTYSGSSNYFKDVPKVSYSGSELYLGFDNLLRITKNSRDGDKTLFNLPEINDQPFADNITGLINISTTQLAIFFDKAITICSKVSDETYGYIYEYQKTRLSLGTRLGDDIINTLDGAATLFANARGLAIMNYQAYMATSDQVLTFISDKIVELWKEFYAKSTNIKIVQMRNYIYISNGTEEYLMLDTRTYTWWKFTVPTKVSKLVTNQTNLYLLSNMLYLFNLNYNKDKYYDEVYDAHGNMTQIPWRLESQRLHFNLPNHYKNIKQLIFQLKQTNKYQNTIRAQIKIFRKVIDYGDPQIVAFNIDEYRTFVKRFNYWKINELQWILANDTETAIPSQLKLNGIDIKYEVGEEVR